MKKGAPTMKLSSFSSFLSEAFSNLIRNRLMVIATIITLSAGLFLSGITSALTFNIFSISTKLQSDFKLEAFIDEAFDMNNKSQLEADIKKIPNIQSIEFYSKEEAFEEFKASFAEPELLEGLDDGSILRDSYKITLQSLQNSSQTVAELEKVNGIAKVTQLADTMNDFFNKTHKIQIATIIISAILGLLSVLIIMNTINMSIFSRKKQINIMKYVGATDGYIRIPFLLEGFIIGVISSALSYGATMYLYNVAMKLIGSYAETFGMLSRGQAALPLLAVVGGEGILLGCIGSSLSIRKHLKV